VEDEQNYQPSLQASAKELLIPQQQTASQHQETTLFRNDSFGFPNSLVKAERINFVQSLKQLHCAENEQKTHDTSYQECSKEDMFDWSGKLLSLSSFKQVYLLAELTIGIWDLRKGSGLLLIMVVKYIVYLRT
jgi:hypothetical protein